MLSTASGRGRGAARMAWRRVVTMPLAARVVVIGLVVTGGFVAVVLPLFNGGGVPRAEIAGAIPDHASIGQALHVDLALDNTGDSIIKPVCVILTGPGTHLVSGNFQGLDQVSATGNRVCGGQLTGQETISVKLVFTVNQAGSTTIQLTPQQGTTPIGPALRATMVVG